MLPTRLRSKRLSERAGLKGGHAGGDRRELSRLCHTRDSAYSFTDPSHHASAVLQLHVAWVAVIHPWCVAAACWHIGKDVRPPHTLEEAAISSTDSTSTTGCGSASSATAGAIQRKHIVPHT